MFSLKKYSLFKNECQKCRVTRDSEKLKLAVYLVKFVRLEL